MTCKGHAESWITCRGKASRIASTSNASRRSEGNDLAASAESHVAKTTRGSSRGSDRDVRGKFAATTRKRNVNLAGKTTPHGFRRTPEALRTS